MSRRAFRLALLLGLLMASITSAAFASWGWLTGSVALPRKSYKIYVYRDGNIIFDGGVDPESNAWRAFDDVVSNDKRRWSLDMNSYAPRISMRSGDGDYITIVDHMIVVGFHGILGRVQKSSRLEAADLDAIETALHGDGIK